MNSRAERLIEAYRKATEPSRWLRRVAWQRAGTMPIVVLFYHRVADTNPTDWTISRSGFAAQLDWLQKHFELLSMDQVHRRLEAGFNDRPAVAITFDDGYAENMDFALPLMAERKIPCLYYVATSFVLNQTFFPHDEALNLQLHPNSVGDLKQILDWGLDIGAHTRTHADIGQITDSQQLHDELAGSRRELMNLLGVAVDHFAFPYGQTTNITAASLQVARNAGYKTVSAAYGGYNCMGCDPFFIQRIHGDPSLPRIKNWTTLDPRLFRVRPVPEWSKSATANFEQEVCAPTSASIAVEPKQITSQNASFKSSETIPSFVVCDETPTTDSVVPFVSGR
ncbi:MAG: polysaccharide deacetylase family protein [Pirellulaceae bacterium]|nr:polysaccharide deacetylase family protein [Pirellulaceae bacterium]